ncbi:hypothetical protein [Rhodopseudomonas sp. P2A-2r]|uniref:hypothetical protein n=1 Tax=unclassified Rhodopseudomonas TaxID=2638247 RepID=UPI0022340B19|nr:hypothetical protein [Rhodopseudomonas sp. P2A-2r]UZE48061.1 hypothetical protein ONR75_24925 [Rhodopseudomonas sp. P2A-2r]
MPTREMPADRIVVSIFCLRNARARLARTAQPRDKSTVEARIDICDELIHRVGEIDRDLRQLSSNARGARIGVAFRNDGSRRDGDPRDIGGVQKSVALRDDGG